MAPQATAAGRQGEIASGSAMEEGLRRTLTAAHYILILNTHCEL